MQAFRRLSVGPTIPELIGEAAAADAVRSARMLPLAVWCRPATLSAMQGKGAAPARWASAEPSRTMAVMAEIQAWTLAAELLLGATRLCHYAGLLSPEGVGAGFRGSLWLTRRGMHAWRRTRTHNSQR